MTRCIALPEIGDSVVLGDIKIGDYQEIVKFFQGLHSKKAFPEMRIHGIWPDEDNPSLVTLLLASGKEIGAAIYTEDLPPNIEEYPESFPFIHFNTVDYQYELYLYNLEQYFKLFGDNYGRV